MCIALRGSAEHERVFLFVPSLHDLHLLVEHLEADAVAWEEIALDMTQLDQRGGRTRLAPGIRAVWRAG